MSLRLNLHINSLFLTIYFSKFNIFFCYLSKMARLSQYDALIRSLLVQFSHFWTIVSKRIGGVIYFITRRLVVIAVKSFFFLFKYFRGGDSMRLDICVHTHIHIKVKRECLSISVNQLFLFCSICILIIIWLEKIVIPILIWRASIRLALFMIYLCTQRNRTLID